ncbi:hypothetical protein SpCBS45565_g01649 [Spizellomyces sp. 'palustris']|nr:hypothetical protein SpCBS45565_g01649 [Spizellomyces sp. 'palustris']
MGNQLSSSSSPSPPAADYDEAGESSLESTNHPPPAVDDAFPSIQTSLSTNSSSSSSSSTSSAQHASHLYSPSTSSSSSSSSSSSNVHRHSSRARRRQLFSISPLVPPSLIFRNESRGVMDALGDGNDRRNLRVLRRLRTPSERRPVDSARNEEEALMDVDHQHEDQQDQAVQVEDSQRPTLPGFNEMFGFPGSQSWSPLSPAQPPTPPQPSSPPPPRSSTDSSVGTSSSADSLDVPGLARPVSTIRRRFVRSLLEAIMSGLPSVDGRNTTTTNNNTSSAGTATATPSARDRIQPPAGMRSANLSDLLQFLRSPPPGAGAIQMSPAEGPAGLSSFLRALRGRRGREAEEPDGGASRRSPVPVLILIGRAVRLANGQSVPTMEANATGETTPEAASQNTTDDRASRLFGELGNGGNPSVASFAESLLSTPPVPAPAPAAPTPSTTNTSAPEQPAGEANAEGTPGQDPANPSARRSIQFMIYFIPNRRRTGDATAGPTAASNVPIPGSSEAPTTVPLFPTQPAEGDPRDRNPLADILSSIPAGMPPLTHLFTGGQSTGAVDATRPDAPPASTNLDGSSPFTMPLPTTDTLNPNTTADTNADPATAAQRPGGRNVVEDFAITIILQLVSNMLREGSMNGPGGLLGGTLSLDIATGAENAGNGMSYEDLLRLAEVLGPARSRNAEQSDVEAQLPTVIWHTNEAAGDDKDDAKGKQRVDDTSSVVSMDIDDHAEPTSEDPVKDEKDKDEKDVKTEPVQWGIKDLLASTREKCMICLTPYEEEDQLRIMRCRHGFHRECLDQWLTQYHNSCPLCRDKAVHSPASQEAPPNVFGGQTINPPSTTTPTTTTTTQTSPTPEEAGNEPRRGGFLRRLMDMFPGRLGGGQEQTATAPAEARLGTDRPGLPAAVIVFLG